MGRKGNDIKVVVMNPEKISHMEETLTKLLYEEYMKQISEEDFRKIFGKQYPKKED
ncbi:hypothetical protein [Clostridium scatologenes]|uniref:Uncharacterized protein n=1 Tax=Clostridium scatologenes TaxID=1548 RepID=A0A0E3M8K8_CLOSL|nr:hypothetical protein [Clostridium scatologenes]AKA68497.1 hypothetical protein CSCA_1372 [Clostridium scatologenes]